MSAYTSIDKYVKSILFKKTKSFATKEQLKDPSHHTYYDVKEVLEDTSSKFIKFNTKNISNILIFDVDKFPHFANEKPPMLEYKLFFEAMTGIEPTYIIETDRGYHVAVGIKNRVFTHFKDSGLVTANYHNLKIIKKEITGMIEADANASNKVCGIYRNPINHPYIFSSKLYTIEELLYSLCLDYEKPSYYISNTISPTIQMALNTGCKIRNKKGFILRSIEQGYEVGNRTNYIYAFLFNQLFKNRSLSKEDLYSIYENKIDTQEVKQLTRREIDNQIESVMLKRDTMYSGVLNINKRGKLSNLMWKLNIHGKRERQQFAQKYTSKTRTQKTVQLIKENFHLSLQDMSLEIDRSVKTIKKYLKKYELGLEIIRDLAFTGVKIDIRASFQADEPQPCYVSDLYEFEYIFTKNDNLSSSPP